MTNRAPKYRCLVCVPPVIVRRPGSHSNHRHPDVVRFEAVKP